MKKINIYNIVKYLSNKRLINWMPDDIVLKCIFRSELNQKLNLDNPKTFNEKLQWLKLNDRKDIYTTMVDKYLVKDYISNLIGSKYVIPTLGVYNSFDEIDFSKLPSQFVIKCTHDSGGLIVCDNKDSLNIDSARKKINSSLKNDYYYGGREWPYKNVKKRIIVEKYLIDEKYKELRDYKFFCFNGKVKYYKIDFDRFSNHQANYYDENDKLAYFGEAVCPPDFDRVLEIPSNIKEMKKIAEIISKDIPFARIDLYNVDGKIFFGEITLYPAGGFGKFVPEEWDLLLGEMIQLPIKSGERKS